MIVEKRLNNIDQTSRVLVQDISPLFQLIQQNTPQTTQQTQSSQITVYGVALLQVLLLSPSSPSQIRQHFQSAKKSAATYHYHPDNILTCTINGTDYTMNFENKVVGKQPSKFPALNRVSMTKYQISTYSKGLYVDGIFFRCSQFVRLVASNEWALATAGDTIIDIFDGGICYSFESKSAVINLQWGPEGLYYITKDMKVELLYFMKNSKTRYSKKTKELDGMYSRMNMKSQLVQCHKFMCVVTPSEDRFEVQVINGTSKSFYSEFGNHQMKTFCGRRKLYVYFVDTENNQLAVYNIAVQ